MKLPTKGRKQARDATTRRVRRNRPLTLWPAERDREQSPGDRAAELWRHLEWQAAAIARSASSTKRCLAASSPSRWEKAIRGLPKIEPSRFIMNMMVSCEPAGPSALPAMHAPNWWRMSMSVLAGGVS